MTLLSFIKNFPYLGFGIYLVLPSGFLKPLRLFKDLPSFDPRSLMSFSVWSVPPQ